MVLKSPYDPDDQIYEHLVGLSNPTQRVAGFVYLLPSLPVRHQGLRETCVAFTGASIAEYHFPSPLALVSNGFFFRNSWGPDWGNNGCGYLPFIDWSIVVEAWGGVSWRYSVDSCQPLQNCQRMSVYGNARRASVAGTVAPSTKETELDTIRPWYVKLLQCAKEYIIKPK
jgi:hypothetical protein